MIPNIEGIKIGQDVEVQGLKEQPSRTYRIDFDQNRISGFVDEREAIKQAAIKILLTERFDYLIYSWNYGVEIKVLYGKSHSVVESELQRTVKEALLIDARILDVRNFEMQKMDGRSVAIQFVIDTDYGESELEVELVV